MTRPIRDTDRVYSAISDDGETIRFALRPVLGWLVRHSHDEEHDKDGDVLREMFVEDCRDLIESRACVCWRPE